MKVVFDTNIFIFAFAIPGGRAEEAYLLCLKRRLTLYTSIPILTEMVQKLTQKFDWDEDKVAHLLRTIAGVAIINKNKPQSLLHLLPGEPNNRVLECAEEVKADIIVTGDKHLLSLKHFKKTDLVTLWDFLRNLSE